MAKHVDSPIDDFSVSRYGENGEKEFKKNLPRCFDELRASTSPTTVILWLTALPISAEPSAAVFDEKCLIDLDLESFILSVLSRL